MSITQQEQKYIGEIIYAIKENIKQEAWQRRAGYIWLRENMTNKDIIQIMEENDIYTVKEFMQYINEALENGKI